MTYGHFPYQKSANLTKVTIEGNVRRDDYCSGLALCRKLDIRKVGATCGCGF